MSVRQAVEADLPRLLDLSAQFHQDSIYAGMPLNLKKVEAMLRQCLQHPMMGAWVWESEDPDGGRTVQGCYAGRVDAWWFSDELVGLDLGVFIDKAHRGSGAAGALFETFKAWARERGARTVSPGVSTGVGLELVARFYEAHGAAKVGYIFLGDLTARA